MRADVDAAVVTRSEKGCLVIGPDGTEAVPAFPVERVVDTTGAGDLFAAGFLCGLARGADDRTCGRLGALAAAEVIQHLGARPEASLKDLARENGLIDEGDGAHHAIRRAKRPELQNAAVLRLCALKNSGNDNQILTEQVTHQDQPKPGDFDAVARLAERPQHQVAEDALLGFALDFGHQPLVVARSDIDIGRG